MALPIREIPKRLRKLCRAYRQAFTKPQYNHFVRLVAGLILSDKKNIQEINDCFGQCDQSSLNRFVTVSEWDAGLINKIRLREIRKRCNLGRGVLVIDPTLLHKTGKKMEKANYHYSGITKEKEWGHCLVDSFFSDWKGNAFPVDADFYVRKEDADEKVPFREVRPICLDLLDDALKHKLPIETVMIDGGLYADFVLQEIKLRRLNYVAGVRLTNKYSINGEKRVSVAEYLQTLTDDDFKRFVIEDGVYHLHSVIVSTRGIGKERLLVSYKDGDEETIKVYTTNLLSSNDLYLMRLLLKRWEIECWHRDAKQHLGLEDYQVRKFGGVQKVVPAVLVAYTQIILSCTHAILKPLQRPLRTIGEGCRFFRLIALKGWKWLKEQAEEVNTLKQVMNQYVFVKDDKVTL